MAAKKTAKKATAKKTAAKKTAAKKTVKKPAAKKSTAKKAAPKKTVAKKTAQKKAVAKKPAVKKTATKKTAQKKTPAKKTAVKKTVKKAAVKPAPKPAPKKTAKKSVKAKFSKKQLAEFREMLLKLRERISGERSFLLSDNLEQQKDTSISDQGSDTFDQEFALNLAGAEQETLNEIEDALWRIEKGTYGVCEMSGELIELERLKALPFTRYSVKAQSELEKGRIKYRPFEGRGARRF